MPHTEEAIWWVTVQFRQINRWTCRSPVWLTTYRLCFALSLWQRLHVTQKYSDAWNSWKKGAFYDVNSCSYRNKQSLQTPGMWGDARGKSEDNDTLCKRSLSWDQLTERKGILVLHKEAVVQQPCQETEQRCPVWDFWKMSSALRLWYSCHYSVISATERITIQKPACPPLPVRRWNLSSGLRFELHFW